MSSEDPIAAKLDALLALTPIPAWERGHDWPSIEAELGIGLPTEYKAYADRFPSGKHRGLIVFHPDVAPLAGPGLVEEVRLYARIFESDGIRAFYPKPGGLIPWADFESDAVLCWLPTGGNPDRWPVAAYGTGGDYEVIPGTTLEALTAVLRGEAGRTVFAALTDDPLRFIPMDLRISAEWGLIRPDQIPPSYH